MARMLYLRLRTPDRAAGWRRARVPRQFRAAGRACSSTQRLFGSGGIDACEGRGVWPPGVVDAENHHGTVVFYVEVRSVVHDPLLMTKAARGRLFEWVSSGAHGC